MDELCFDLTGDKKKISYACIPTYIIIGSKLSSFKIDIKVYIYVPSILPSTRIGKKIRTGTQKRNKNVYCQRLKYLLSIFRDLDTSYFN